MKFIKKQKEIFHNIDKLLLIVTISLLIFGLVNIVTASSREAVLVNEQGIYYYFYRQIGILLVGMIGSIIILNVPTKYYTKIGAVLYVLVAFLIIYCFFQTAKRGAQNWISIGGFQFQPSELAKPVLIVCLSCLFEKYYKIYKSPHSMNYNWILGITFIVLVGIPAAIFLQKDFGTMFIILLILGILFISSPLLKEAKIKFMTFGIIVVLVICVGLLATKGHVLTSAQLSRFDYINPCSKYEKPGGYQACNAQIAFNDGGLFGLGIGKSKQKYSYIPEPHTDSIFAIIGEEWGVLRCLVFVFIPYAILLYKILDIANNSNTLKGKYMAIGISMYIFAHIFINMGGLFGIIPLTGVPLPFLSYGGTYTVCLMASVAIVQRICYESRTQKINIKNSK